MKIEIPYARISEFLAFSTDKLSDEDRTELTEIFDDVLDQLEDLQIHLTRNVRVKKDGRYWTFQTRGKPGKAWESGTSRFINKRRAYLAAVKFLEKRKGE